MNEIEKVQGMGYYLIEQCRQTNAEAMRLELKGVHRKGEKLGDWELLVRKIQPGNLGTASLESLIEWLVSDDTGMSSRYLASCAIGKPLEQCSTPSDPSDLGRCIRMMAQLSESEQKDALDIAAKQSDRWVAIRDHWPELEDLYRAEEENPDGRAPKLYARMKDLGL